jgi:hypothetical protein
MKVHKTHFDQITGTWTREWDENVPNARLTLPSRNGIESDTAFTDYVELTQEDNSDEYYHQTVAIRKQDIQSVITFLQSFLDKQ